MHSDHSVQSETLNPMHIVMIVLVIAIVGGGCFLLSTPRSTHLMEGAVEWHEGSPLRAFVQLLCLNYQAATLHAGTIKNYVLGIGAGLSIIVLVVAIVVRDKGENHPKDSHSVMETAMADDEQQFKGLTISNRRAAPLLSAQVLVILYILWSFASSRWSSAPGLAVGGSALLAIQFLWSLGLGHGLNSRAACVAARFFFGIIVATAVIAIWYYYGRNPGLRAMFPFGNPTFLSACLIPGIVLSISFLVKIISDVIIDKRKLHIGLVLLTLLAGGLCIWSFTLARSRGPAVGILFAMLAMLFFSLRGRQKWLPVILALFITSAGLLYLNQQSTASSPTGRSATIRLRMYAWSYAWQMFQEKPFTGHGQGGFVLQGDAHASNDVHDDPEVFESRIAHAHNEWLEVMADLGMVGILLIVSALLLTFRAGVIALQASLSGNQRWIIIGLLSTLVGLIADACFGVGLRVSGVPTIYFTVLGLTWALCQQGHNHLILSLSKSRSRRIITGVVGISLGLAAMATANQDWSAARNAHRAEESFRHGDPDQAISYATASIGRLNPQRALSHLFRLVEAHLRAARILQNRGLDRHRRSVEPQPPNPRMVNLALQDIQFSDQQCEVANLYVKELVSRSPGFINHGWLEYQINMIQSDNVQALAMMINHDGPTPGNGTLTAEVQQKKDQFVQNALKSIERELQRQPFQPVLAMNYIRVKMPEFDWPKDLDVLAKPLRFNSVNDHYLEVLVPFASDSKLQESFGEAIEDIHFSLNHPADSQDHPEPVDEWIPEKLRLWSAVKFIQGDYVQARDILEQVVQLYENSDTHMTLGLGDSYDWLAVCRFYVDPGSPDEPIASSIKAIQSTPHSGPGREFIETVKQRMIHYYLAADDEQAAIQLLRETAPPGFTDDMMRNELGARYTQLSQIILRRRESRMLRKPVNELLPKLQLWLHRAMTLNANDPMAYYLSADLAFHADQYEKSARLIEQSLDRGLPVKEAWKFVTIAKQKKPGIQAIDTLWDKLFKIVQQQPRPEQIEQQP